MGGKGESDWGAADEVDRVLREIVDGEDGSVR